ICGRSSNRPSTHILLMIRISWGHRSPVEKIFSRAFMAAPPPTRAKAITHALGNGSRFSDQIGLFGHSGQNINGRRTRLNTCKIQPAPLTTQCSPCVGSKCQEGYFTTTTEISSRRRHNITCELRDRVHLRGLRCVTTFGPHDAMPSPMP